MTRMVPQCDGEAIFIPSSTRSLQVREEPSSAVTDIETRL
jgi:hypothetical protein